MAAATVELLDDHNCVLGEGPVWDELTQSLYWVDIVGKKVLHTPPWPRPSPTSSTLPIEGIILTCHLIHYFLFVLAL